MILNLLIINLKSMERIFDPHILANIFNFFDILTMINYDNSITSKDLRPLFLITLQYVKSIIFHANKWTYLRNITILNFNCHYLNLEYYPFYNKKLIIYGGNNKTSKYAIKVINNNIEELLFCLYKNKNLYIDLIKGINIKKIIFINVFNIDKNVFINLSNLCKNLKKIIFISSECDLAEIKYLVNNKNIIIK